MSVKILTIAVLLFFVSCWSPEDARSQPLAFCCLEAGSFVSGAIIDCVQQKPNKHCNSRNYLVRLNDGNLYCIKSDSKWIKKQIQTRKISCRS